MPPPAPEPTITASQSFSCLRMCMRDVQCVVSGTSCVVLGAPLYCHRRGGRASAATAQRKAPSEFRKGLFAMSRAARYGYCVAQPPEPALTQLRCTRKSLPPRFMLATEPLVVVYVVPKVQAHLSAFSNPRRSYHA